MVDYRGWRALAPLSLGFLLIGMNATSVNLALPSLEIEFGLSERSLVWVVNSYLLTLSGFLLVGGRLGDFFGHSRMFLFGIIVFTSAMLGCTFAFSTPSLIATRAAQGIGAAIVSAAALPAIANIFTDTTARARALSIRATVGASGASVGSLFGGAIVSACGWRGMFLANAILGACVFFMAYPVLPRERGKAKWQHIDVGGAVTATATLLLVIYIAVGSDRTAGGYSIWSFVLLLIAVAFGIGFVEIEKRVPSPILPFGLLRAPNFVIANVCAALWSAAVLTGNIVAVLYLQRVLKLSPLQAGLMFLPATVAGALIALLVTPILVSRFGFKRPLTLALLVAAGGLALLTFAAADGSAFRGMLPGILLMVLSNGLIYSPLMLGALSGVPPSISGAASGVINSSLMVGGSVGLALLMGAATLHTSDLLASGSTLQSALSAGYRVAFVLASLLALLAVALCILFVRNQFTRVHANI